MPTKIGKQIQFYRKKEKLSQAELANKLHVTRQAISSWERDVSEPDLDSLRQMAQIFNIPVQTLIEETIDDTVNKQLKTVKLLYVITFLTFLYCSREIIFFEQNIFFLLFFILFVMSSVLFLTFLHAIHTNDYTMIDGFDETIQYHTPTINKILIKILIQVLTMHTLMNVILMYGIAFEPLTLPPIVFGMYFINFFASIFITNKKYQTQLYVNKEDFIKSRSASFYGVYFILNLLVMVLGIILSFVLHNIQNNSKEALLILSLLIPFLGIHITILIVAEEKRKNNETLSKKWFLFGAIITILCTLIMLFYPY